MTLLRSFPKLSFVLVLLSIVGISIAQRSVGLLLVAGALAAMSWYLTEGPRGRWLPKWVSNVLVIAVSLNVIVDVTQHPEDILGVLGRFILWLVIIKLYERRTARDHAHLLGLSVLLMVAGCLQTVDLFFGLILAVYVLLGLYVLLLFQLHSSHEQAQAQRQSSIPPDYRLTPSMRPISGRGLGVQFKSLVVGIAVLGFALGTIVFLLFPRGVGEGVVPGMPSPSSDRRPGFVSDINLFAGGRITDSRRAVMSMQILDSEGRPIVAAEPLLLRGAVLDRYEGRGRWRSSSGTLTDLRVGSDRQRSLLGDAMYREDTAAEFAADERIVSQHFELLHSYDTLFSMYAPIAVQTDHEQVLRVDRVKLTIGQRDRTEPLTRYSITAALDPSEQTMAQLTTGSDFGSYMLRLRSTAVRELARQLLRDAGLDDAPSGEPGSTQRHRWVKDAAATFTAYLRSPEFTYDTDLGDVVIPVRDGRRVDPIRYFLLDLKRGHCEYFSSALMALCYNVGIDARMIAGYVAYDYDNSAQQYNVVEANAHAWVEVRTGDYRWQTFDPTPPAVLRELHQGSGGMTDRLRWLYDSLDGAWGRTVVDFDRARQAQLAESELTTTWSQRFKQMMTRFGNWLDRVNRSFHLGPAGYIYMSFVACVLIFAVGVLIKLMRRSLSIKRVLQLKHVRSREQHRMLRQLGFYLDMLRVLKRAGHEKPHWQPPMMFAQQLQQRHARAGNVVNRLTDLFYQARYGRAGLSTQQVGEARTMVRELAKLLEERA